MSRSHARCPVTTHVNYHVFGGLWSLWGIACMVVSGVDFFEYWWYDGINGKIKMFMFACSRRESCTHNDFHAWTTAAEDCAPWWHGPRYLQIGENRSRHAAWRLLQGSGVVPRPCPSWSSSMSSHVSICKTGNVFPSQLHRCVGSLF